MWAHSFEKKDGIGLQSMGVIAAVLATNVRLEESSQKKYL
jgi:hypothetical protein